MTKTPGDMALLPDATSPLPLYHQMYVVLRQQITEGAFGPDHLIPSEHELARMFKVSRITVRRALDMLKQEGMIERHRGRGTFATKPASASGPIRSSITGLLENLIAMGHSTEVKVIDFRYVDAPEEIAAALNIATGMKVQKVVRVRLVKGTPMSHLTTWVPEAIGHHYSEEDLVAGPLLPLLEQSGIELSSAQQVITARLADSTVADLLGIQVGLPLLAINRTVFDQDDQAVEFIQALYRPDLYEYRMSMSRKVVDDSVVWEPNEA